MNGWRRGGSANAAAAGLLASLTLMTALPACHSAPVAGSGVSAPAKKRAAPEPVLPVQAGPVRYEVVPWGSSRGFDRDGGVIRAVDAASGRELWLLEVYRTRRDPTLETDKQEIFITRLRAGPDGRSLWVETERGQVFRIDLGTRAVVHESGPALR